MKMAALLNRSARYLLDLEHWIHEAKCETASGWREDRSDVNGPF